MPLRNRVTPLGELVAVPDRGLVYGNRGCLHDEDGVVRRPYAVKRWIACQLEFKGWRRGPLLQPGRFTELFFLDDATALAAGHRPCALCRRGDYDRFVELWRGLHPDDPAGVDALDARLHRERLTEPGRPHGTHGSHGSHGSREQRHHDARLEDLPDGVFVLMGSEPCLVHGGDLLPWTPAGYLSPVARGRGRARVITPPSLVRILRRGWRPRLVPFLHPTAHPG